MPAVIAKFHDRFPEVNVTIVECPVHLDAEQILREGRADIGFTLLPTTDEFEAWEILRDEYVLLIPPNTKFSDPPTWTDIATLPLIVPPADQPCEIDLYRHFARFAAPLNIVHKINQDSTIVSMVMQNLGVGILPRLAAEPIPEVIQTRSLPHRTRNSDLFARNSDF